MGAPRPWSDLPMDILKIICKKLTIIFNFTAFGAVCSHWRSAFFHCMPPQVPLLMFPKVYSKHPVFSYPDFHKHVLHSRQEFLPCYGSSYGWLVTRGLLKDSLQQSNPFLSVNNVIQLSCPERKEGISKAVLSNDPSKTSNYSVIVLNDHKKLTFSTVGDSSWTRINLSCTYGGFQDIAYYKDGLYALTYSGNLLSCNIHATLPFVTNVTSLPFNLFGVYDRYLVVSAGDLLCVELLSKADGGEFGGCQVFKLGTAEGKWVNLKNIGGRAIFLSQISCLTVSASDLANCKPDHIYLSKNNWMCRNETIFEFNLVDETIHQFQLQEFMFDKFSRMPVWIQPTRNMVTSTN